MLLQDLSPDPNEMTHALLLALLNTTSGIPATAPLPQWTGPSRSVVWVQSLLYASLACSLFAALGAVLGKQWLIYYRSVGQRGTLETRGKERHRKLLGVEAWHLRTILSFLPILLQVSLILFGIALCAFMWTLQRTIAIVLICLGGVAAIFYFYTAWTSIWIPDSPFHTPLSDIVLRFSNYLHGWYSQLSFRQKETDVSSDEPSDSEGSADIETQRSASLRSKGFTARLHAVFQYLIHAHFLSSRDRPSAVASLAADDGDQFETVLTSRATMWLLETSTDPIVHADALQILSQIHWPRNMIQELPLTHLDTLLRAIAGCFQSDGRGGKLRAVSLNQPDRLSALCSAFLFLYWERYALDVEEVSEWTRISGRTIIGEWPDFLDGLCDVGYNNDVETRSGFETVCLMYLTVGPYFTYTSVNNPISPGLLFASTPMETIQYRTAVYLSEATLRQSWPNGVAVLQVYYAVGRAYSRANHRRVRDVLFLSFAALLDMKQTVFGLSPDQ